MKKKIVFAFVVSLFVIVFMPKAVSADYAQSTDDIKKTGVVRVDSYEKDENGDVEFDYAKYNKLVQNGVIKDNKFDTSKYTKLSTGWNANEYLEQIKTAYTSVPETEKDEKPNVNEIINYINSDIVYNEGKGLAGLSDEKYTAWIDVIERNVMDAISRREYQPYLELLKGYKSKDAKNITNLKQAVLDKANIAVKLNEKQAVNPTLYICKSHTVENSNFGSPFGMTKEYYQYDSSKYSKGEHYEFGVINKTIENTYKLFKSTKNGVKMDTYTVDGVISEIGATTQSNVCTDEYNDKILSYDEYESLVNTFNITNNQITVEQLEKQKTSRSSEDSDYTQCKDGWWKCAWKFAAEGSASRHTFGVEDVSALSDIEDMLFSIGNIIFILITAFLGVKYIWGGVDSKYSVKNSLVTLVVSAIVFYGWNAVTNMLDVQTLLTGAEAADKMSMVYKIYNTIMYIINIAAVAGIIYIGIKYMMAGADGKSELKLKGIPVIMGIIMVYGTINLIEFILKIVEGI